MISKEASELPPGGERPPAGDKEELLRRYRQGERPPAGNREEWRFYLEGERAMFLLALGKLAQWAFFFGDKSMPLMMIYFYFECGVLPPKWARDAFVAACQSAPESWDAAFGKPFKNRKKVAREEKAFLEGQRILKQPGRKHKVEDSDLFIELGEALGIPAGTAKGHYYGHAKQGRIDSPH
jgi:hypothetical protein